VSGPLLTARQVADLVGVNPETILRYTRAGELRGIRLPGPARGRLRYRPEDVEAWLEAHATAAPGREAPATLSDAADGRLTFPAPAIPPRDAASTEEDN
jgi:excisionase family DNA binding protein